MSQESDVRKALREIGGNPYHLLDDLYISLDRDQVRRTRNIRLIPGVKDRRGGKHSYAEWAHVIGIFQTLMFLHLQNKQDNMILDVGCGTGLLAIASEPFLGQTGRYTGIDVVKEDVDFCRGHYPSPAFEFIHFDTTNAFYAPERGSARNTWPVKSDSIDLTTALSVWTHLGEDDAVFYFNEISRVLKPNGKAIVTFFLLDETYRNSLETRSDQAGRFHQTSQDLWIFDQPSYGSDMWFHPEWAKIPENAIGVNEAGLERLLKNSGLKLIDHHQGNWKEVPGVFFQDVLVFQKT